MKTVSFFLVCWVTQGFAQSALQVVNKTLEVAAGYPVEEHLAETSDGYILKLFRIPGSAESPPAPGKKVVFLMHAYLSCAYEWIVLGPGKSLPYLLADAGYDVWLGNARGNVFSKSHVSLSPDQTEFWQFGLYEIGTIDAPTMIDFILNKTDQETLHYIGHSQGCTTFFIMASELPEYNEKIATMNAFAPVVYLSHVASPILKAMMALTPETISSILGPNEAFCSNDTLMVTLKKACGGTRFVGQLCVDALFLMVGIDSKQFDREIIPKVLAYSPSGVTTKTTLHFHQIANSGKFRQFDYGDGNFAKYGTSSPPEFDLNKVTAPIFLHYGENDWLATETDVEQLVSELPNLAEVHKVPYRMFNHIDFLVAIDVKSFLYDHVLEILAAN